MNGRPIRNRPECERSWAKAPDELVGRVVACPDRECGKRDVVVSRDFFGVAVYEPHMFVVRSAKPRGHLPACRGDDGKVEDCFCGAERGAA